MEVRDCPYNCESFELSNAIVTFSKRKYSAGVRYWVKTSIALLLGEYGSDSLDASIDFLCKVLIKGEVSQHWCFSESAL